MSATPEPEPVKLCELDAIVSGEVASIEIDGTEIAYARVGDQLFAVDAICSHAKVSLADGLVDEDDLTLECPKHGALFSLETGEALTLPAIKPIRTHDVTVDGTEVFVTLVSTEDNTPSEENESDQ